LKFADTLEDVLSAINGRCNGQAARGEALVEKLSDSLSREIIIRRSGDGRASTGQMTLVIWEALEK